MIKKIFHFRFSHQPRLAILQLLGAYIIFSELIKTGAKIYILEQSLEAKLVLFSLAVVLMYKVTDLMIISSIVCLLVLSSFGVPTGLWIYTFVFYSFVRLFRLVARSASE